LIVSDGKSFMSVRSAKALQKLFRRLCDEAVPQEDAVLLGRFVANNEREAFELLIARHGPMVLGTARRLVYCTQDAEDVFQAVFLSFARSAKTLRHGQTIPAWLHIVTCRIAAKVRKNRVSPPKAPPPEPSEFTDPGATLAWREVCHALDEELQRLPERLRSPLLLCYLSGLTRDEAALQLGWKLGTLKRRLEEGRKALRTRLERRGIAAVGLAISVLTPGALQAAVDKSLIESCIHWIFSTGAVVPSTISVLLLGSTTALKGLAMKSILVLVVAVGIGFGLHAGSSEPDPAKKMANKKEDSKQAEGVNSDESKDPLPVGTTLRFGTSRFRHGTPIANMDVSQDGKFAVTVNGNHWLGITRVFDLASGRALFTIDKLVGTPIEKAVISPDGRTIITRQEMSLCVRDAATGKELRTIALPKLPGNSRSLNELLAFTPDGKTIAVTSVGNVIHLLDFESGNTIRDFPHESVVYAIAFSPDGKLMACGGYDSEKSNYFARLWDVETGEELRRYMHGKNGGIRNLAFSPDGKTLASGGDDARLRLWEVATGKEQFAFPKDGNRIRSVAWSPDGKTLAAAGNFVRLFDAATRKERLGIDRKASGLQFTDGGKTLTGAVNGAIYRWDAATGKALTPESAGDSIVEQVLVRADGGRVITRGQDGDAHIWDGITGEHLRAFKTAKQNRMAMSPDGRFLVWAVGDPTIKYKDPRNPNIGYEGSRLRQYDIAEDKFIERFPGFQGDAQDVTFSNDGKRLISVDHGDGVVRVWNVEVGKEERSFQAVPEAERNLSHHVRQTILSPDGKTLAVAYDENAPRGNTGLGGGPHFVRLWDVSTGKEIHRLEGHVYYVLDMAFSPDGRFLVSAGEKTRNWGQQGSPEIDQVFVWDTVSGTRVDALPKGLPLGAVATAFSRDCRFLATATPEGSILIWEVATWTVRNTFQGHRDRPTVLTFMPGGKLLSGSVDTTVLAWDLRPPSTTSSVTLEAAWNDLIKKEAAEVYKTEGRFLASSAETVKFLGEKIQPVKAPDENRVKQLIVELGSPEFKMREAASKSLSVLGQQVKPYLEDAAKSSSSPEVQGRVQRVLDGMKTLIPEQIRQLRAVQILELLNNDYSVKLLNKWAGGLRSTLLTQEAEEALKRLKAIPPSK
jgi:RNA polymerase sigma factor (sigma-70 family)